MSIDNQSIVFDNFRSIDYEIDCIILDLHLLIGNVWVRLYQQRQVIWCSHGLHIRNKIQSSEQSKGRSNEIQQISQE